MSKQGYNLIRNVFCFFVAWWWARAHHAATDAHM